MAGPADVTNPTCQPLGARPGGAGAVRAGSV